MTVDIFYVGFSILIFNFHYALAVPPGYCLTPLNTSDCGTPPTPVFSYYKPGSRCEIEFWRGCPTYNKFNDEFICSNYCIGRLNTNTEDEEIKDKCAVPLDTGDCGAEPTTVYTFDGYACVNATWKGCATFNMFDDYSHCLAQCQPSLKEWKDEIETLDEESVGKIDDLLEEVLDELPEEIEVLEKEVETTTIFIQKLNYNGAVCKKRTTTVPPPPTTEELITTSHFGQAEETVTP